MKNQKLKFLVLTCTFTFLLLPFTFSLYAQEDNKLVTLSKQIIEAKSNPELYPLFKELKDLYFSRQAIPSEGGIPRQGGGKETKYADFVEFLKSLGQKKKGIEPFVNYYTALARYSQLKYLQESQNWDEYFSLGNTYRDEITQNAEKVILSTTIKDPLNVYARLLLWRFHKDQEDAFRDTALQELMTAALEYSQSTIDTAPIKEAADQLRSYKELGRARELYKIYVNKLVTSQIKDAQLQGIAVDFYKEGNLELSQVLYDTYIERVTPTLPKEKLIPVLIDIARMFAYKDDANNDPLYAQKLFQKIEEVGGKSALDEELIYLRAFNLEKAKEYIPARDGYLELVKRYPESLHNDEADFKTAIIYTYVVRDINSGRSYFEKLAKDETVSPQVISSIYQLGLLKQWEGDLVKAKEYYDKLIERAKDGFVETKALALERLKEIAKSAPIEYNLKTFLDVSLKEEYAMLDMTKLDLKAHPYKVLKKEEVVNISSRPYVGETGCLQVELQYLWSGHIGTAKPTTEQEAFNTDYLHNGSKEVNLVVISPGGIVDRDLVMTDVSLKTSSP